MKREISVCSEVCDMSTGEGGTPKDTTGLLQPLPIPEWKWKHITVNFVTTLSRSPKGNNAVWVIVDRFMKSAYFISLRLGQSTEVLAENICRRWSDSIVY